MQEIDTFAYYRNSLADNSAGLLLMTFFKTSLPPLITDDGTNYTCKVIPR